MPEDPKDASYSFWITMEGCTTYCGQYPGIYFIVGNGTPPSDTLRLVE